MSTTESTTLAQREPAALVGLITSFVTAGLVLAAAFGLDLTKEQIAALGVLAGATVPLVQAIITRAKVVSPATSAARVEAAVAAVQAEPEPKPRRALVEG